MASGIEPPDMRQVTQRLQALETGLVTALAQALYTRAQQIMSRSRPLVPVVTGALRASALVYPPQIQGNTISVVFGYGGQATPYAAAVHENPRSGRTGGVSPTGRRYPPGTYSLVGQWHYLLDPMTEIQRTFPQDVVVMMRDVLRRGGQP